MDAPRWQRLTDIFHGAIARTGDDRHAFVGNACAGDDALRAAVQRLLDAHDRAAQFLERPALAGPISAGPDDNPLTSANELGAYRVGAEFTGTERFAVLRALGSGGMGVVYEVLDRTRNEVVALKTLHHARPTDIYTLKREFRSLADVAHPNLVALYELFVDDETAFFTMEMVEGVHFTHFIDSDHLETRAERARHALLQLVEGVAALHRRGMLHRDIKPSNILVTPAGRVVLLDFGLLSSAYDGGSARREQMAGTPAYFAPERHAGAPPSPSQDWYSVGVTLYQALTGRLPFDSTLRERPGQQPASPPGALPADLPEDLGAICMGLLRDDPENRFTDRHVLSVLARPPSRLDHGDADDSHGPLVGRSRQLARLVDAWRVTQAGQPATVFIHGESGIGKSALVDAFLDVSRRDPKVLLHGRCYEHESVPYKGVDGVIDSLSEYLTTLPRADALSLIPPDAASLARLFPVMHRVSAHATREFGEHGDPVVARQRAFGALRELLTRLASRKPIVMFIDDVHWADADSALLLGELLHEPGTPPMLTIACGRTDEIVRKPFLDELFTANASSIVLRLDPITLADSRALIGLMTATHGAVPADDVEAMAREAGGNPFLLRQLIQYASTRPDRRESAHSLAHMVLEPIGALPEAQSFLRLLAICGRPMSPDFLSAAAGLHTEFRPLLRRLRTTRLVRSSGSAERVEIYHDRIRETLVASMSREEKRDLHAALARTMVARRLDEPEALFAHHREAGDYEAAAEQAAVAADRAHAVLAFDRAATFYRAALDLSPGTAARSEWRERLATALANAGRPVQAADTFLEAARDADVARRFELQRRAAEQFLLGGHIDKGLDTIRSVLHAVGLQLPSSPRRTLAALAWRRAVLRLRGLDYRPRPAERASPEDLLRIDTCWSVASGLGLVDTMRAAYFQTRCLLLALSAGEPYRIARSLSAEAGFIAVAGGKTERAAAALAARAHAIAASAGSPHAIALTTLSTAIAAFMAGRWPEASRRCGEALAMLREQSNVVWETMAAQRFLLGAMTYEGRLREVTATVDRLLASARENGNVYWDTELRTGHALVWLIQDRPGLAIQSADEAIARWSHEGFHRQHYNHLLAHLQTALYCGRADEAWARFQSRWPAVRRSLLRRMQWTRIETSYWHARIALAMAASSEADRGRFAAIADHEAHRIRREHIAWTDPVASLLHAAVFHIRGDDFSARRLLANAADGFERAGMRLHAAVARRRHGELTDDERGASQRSAADTWMASEGIVRPHRIVRLIAPGFGETDRATDDVWIPEGKTERQPAAGGGPSGMISRS